MSLKWVDVLEIAIQLAESKPEVDPRYVNFVDLHSLGAGIARVQRRSVTRQVRKCLRRIQAAWIDEADLSVMCRLGNPLKPAYNSRV